MSETPQATGEKLPFDPEQYSLEEILKPGHSALVVVDMQNDFLHPEGNFAHLEQPTEQMRSIVPQIQGLIETAHQTRIPVIFTKGYEDLKFRNGPDRRRAVKWGEIDRTVAVNSESGTWGSEFYEGIGPQEGDTVVIKHKWSAFDGKDESGKTFKQILDQLGIKTLVITGVVAQTCIETTIRDAYDHDYFVVIPEHCVGSNDQTQLSARMNYWSAGFIGDVVSEAQVQRIWQPTPAVSETKSPTPPLD